jgi:CRP-like cAMP-binding protein
MLRRCRVFDELDDAELATIAGLAAGVDGVAGGSVVEQGDPADNLYVIAEGRVQVVRSGRVAADLAAGDFFGEMAMFNRSRRVAAVRAVEDTRLVAIPERSLQPLVLRQEPAAIKLVQRLGALTLERMQRFDVRLGDRLAHDDPALAAAFEEYQQLKQQLLGGWALAYHALGKPGKLAVTSTKPSATAADLSVAYSPGVAEPCLAIRDDPDEAYAYTTKANLVAVVSNGTAVLGLGAIGALASKPVMEGKAVLFKRFADVDAFDIEVDETDPRTFVDTVVRIAPTFGGINLEDIAAPHCFWIEEECKRRLDIPVMHDDQHGTAIIVGAALVNALELVDKRLEDVRVVFSGAGAAGGAAARYLIGLGVRRAHLLLTDIDGVVHTGRDDPPHLQELAADTDLRTLAEAIVEAGGGGGGGAPGRGAGARETALESGPGAVEPRPSSTPTCSAASALAGSARRRCSVRWLATRSCSPSPTPCPRSTRSWRGGHGPTWWWRRAGATMPTRSTTCWRSPTCSGGHSTRGRRPSPMA